MYNIVYYIANKKVETVARNISSKAMAKRIATSKKRLYQYQMGRMEIETTVK